MKKYFKLLLFGSLVGLIAGLVAVAYRYCLTWAEAGMYGILEQVRNNMIYAILWFLGLIILGILVSKITKWEPMAGGSGIPQVTGEYNGDLETSWWRVILAKFLGGTGAILGGLSLGREGPSIQLGAMTGKGLAKIFKSDSKTEKTMLVCGAGAGLSAAFNAPFSGVLFVVEEILNTDDKDMLTSGILAAVVADFVSKAFFGQKTIFDYDSGTLELSYYWIYLLFAIILGLLGAGYNYIMLKGQAFFKYLKSINIPMEIYVCAVFILAGIFGIFIPDILAGGHSMVEILEHSHPALHVLFVLLILKFVFSAISFGSGVPGGIFFPLLILGSYVGAIFGDIVINLVPAIGQDMWYQFIILGMVGMFAGIVRAPLTGVILITEMTGSMNKLIDVILVSAIAYVVANMTGSKPIYESLLDNILASKRKEKKEDIKAK